MKEIILTKGYKALVDDEDFNRISSFTWTALVGFHVRAYRTEYRKFIYMHHEVLSIDSNELKDKEIDHIDRNPLNNQKENLRIVNHTENMRNTRRHIERKGYCYNNIANLWSVYLDSPGKPRKYLGYTRTKQEAIERIAEARRENN